MSTPIELHAPSALTITDASSPLRTALDVFAQTVDDAITPTIAAGIKQTGDVLLAAIEQADATFKAAKDSGFHTRRGLEQLRATIFEPVMSAITEGRAQVAALERQAQIEHADTVVKGRPVVADPVRQLEVRELRDLLRARHAGQQGDDLLTAVEYHNACRDGSNDLLIAAIETAPRGFGLVSQRVIDEGIEIRARRAHPLLGTYTLQKLHLAKMLTAAEREAALRGSL